MSHEQVRVACPACGKRFRLDPASVPRGGTGRESRCGGCGVSFLLRRQGDTIRVGVASTQPAPSDLPSVAPRPRTRGRSGAAAPRPPAERRRPATPMGASSTPAPGEPTLPRSGDAGTPFGIGDRVGRYEIEGVLARGGMGSIFKAYDPAGNRHVALKVLVSSATDLDKLRFQREIQVQGNIQHPHIMPIFDSGVIGSTRFYTMELLKDPLDLIELAELARSGEAAKDPKLRPVASLHGLVRGVVLPVCRAIHHANVNEGVLHRDLKPGNVLLDRNGLRPFVIDFGVSSLLEKKNARLAHLDRELPVPLRGKGISITGTLVFMPPEQARGRADRRGDVWALGALLHYLVAGEPPLEGAVRPVVSRAARIEGLQMLIEQARREGRLLEVEEFRHKLEAIQSGQERTVEQLRADVLRGRYRPRPDGVPRGLDAIVTKAMAPDPTRRYRHALELHDDLSAWLDGRPVSALVKRSGAARGALYRGRLLLRRHKALALALFVLGVVGVLAVRLWPRPPHRDQRADAARLLEEALEHERAGRVGEARRQAREALRKDPQRDDAFELMERLDGRERLWEAVRRARALREAAFKAFDEGDESLGRRRQAALEEVVESQVLPRLGPGTPPELPGEMHELLLFASGSVPLRVTGAPGGTIFEVVSVEAPGGRIHWDGVRVRGRMDGGDGAALRLSPGAWILVAHREGGTVMVPFRVRPGRAVEDVVVPCDPAEVDARSAYVPAGPAVGPGRVEAVGALLWDRTEVSAADYAAFLASLGGEERRRRVPRRAGPLGSLGEPLWDRQGESFMPPAGAARRPVEGISLYDARAYAAWAGGRLPTAAEWAWAASGPDGRPCPVGGVRELLAGTAHVDRPLAGVTDLASTPADRSPFGLFDMTGNVAEFTSTLGSLQGESGWFVMGGCYMRPAADALIHGARVVPGWMPLLGVGLRCVRAASR